MGSTCRFVTNQSLWHELQSRVTSRGPVLATFAYFGDGGADLLPLRKNDRLVVDMSIGAVKQGVTDPYEVRRLVKKGVLVFTRGNLHAKFMIAGGTLIAGSANVSRNSRNILDEAGILTTDAAAVKRAKAFFTQLCTEPVRPKYLAECIRNYRPPVFKAAVMPGRRKRRSQRVVEAKLWLVRGLRYLDIPRHEWEKADAAERRASTKLSNPDKTEVDTTHYPKLPALLKNVRPGDWVITEIRYGTGSDVSAPAAVLSIDSYPRGGGKRRYLLQREMPISAEDVSGGRFRKLLRSIDPELADRRTRAVVDEEKADRILRLWTPGGRLSRKGN